MSEPVVEKSASGDLTTAVQDWMVEAPIGARDQFEREAADLISLAALIKTAATTMDRLSAARNNEGYEAAPGLPWLADFIADELTEDAARVFLTALRT